MKVHILYAILLILSLKALSQNENAIRKTEYKNSLNNYSSWLKDQNISQFLKMDTFKVENDIFILYLGFNNNNDDTVRMIWSNLTSNFKLKNNGYSLEPILFYQLVHTLKLNPNAVEIKICNNRCSNSPCVYTNIYYNNKLIVNSNICKDPVVQTIVLNAGEDLKSLLKGSKQIDKSYTENTKKLVLNASKSYLLDYYKNKAKTIEVLSTYPKLVVEVKGLRKEVLTDEDNSWICNFINWTLNKNCDWRIREWLTFTIACNKMEQGIDLEVQILGKFGSGIITPKDNGYMDMMPDFTTYINRYTKVISEKIKNALEK